MRRPTSEERIAELRRRIEMADDVEALLEDPRWISILEVLAEFKMLILREIADPDAKRLDYNRGRFAVLDQVSTWIGRAVRHRDRFKAELIREMDHTARAEKRDGVLPDDAK